MKHETKHAAIEHRLREIRRIVGVVKRTKDPLKVLLKAQTIVALRGEIQIIASQPIMPDGLKPYGNAPEPPKPM